MYDENSLNDSCLREVKEKREVFVFVLGSFVMSQISDKFYNKLQFIKYFPSFIIIIKYLIKNNNRSLSESSQLYSMQEQKTSSSQNFRYSFLFISFLGFICCLDRADYNVALGIFAFLLWNEYQFPQKHRVLWTILISIIGDLLWIIFVSVIRWNQQPQGYNNKLRILTQIVSIINMVYKIIIMVYAICSYEHSRDLFKLESFNKKFLYL